MITCFLVLAFKKIAMEPGFLSEFICQNDITSFFTFEWASGAYYFVLSNNYPCFLSKIQAIFSVCVALLSFFVLESFKDLFALLLPECKSLFFSQNHGYWDFIFQLCKLTWPYKELSNGYHVTHDWNWIIWLQLTALTVLLIHQWLVLWMKELKLQEKS